MKIVTCLLAAGSLLASVPCAAEVRLNGASTTVNAVINPHKAAVEAVLGAPLKVVGTNTGKGMAALMAGQCDAALTSEPLDVAMIAARFMGLNPNPADFQIHAVDEAELVFVVHPSNPVQRLTAEQVRDLHAGRITNWNQVGGPDVPVIVFTDLVGAGTRTLIQSVLLGGGEFGPKVRAMESIRYIAGSIGEMKGGFGGIGLSFVDPKLVKRVDTPKITRPLGFITKGAPTPDVQKVIDAFRAEVLKARK